MKSRYLFILLFAAVCCTDPIDVNTGRHVEPCLAVDGMVTDRICHQVINLSMTEDFCSPSKVIPAVSGAQITVYDGDLAYAFEEDAAKPGKYCSREAFKGETGRRYRLEIDVMLNGAMSHFSAEDIMPEQGAQLDSIDYACSPDIENLWTLAVWGRDKLDMKSRYLLQTGVNGHFKPIDQSVEAPDDHIDGTILNGFVIAALHHTPKMWRAYGECYKPLEAGDVVTLRVSTLSEGYGEFMMYYSHFIVGTLPILTDQPTNLTTNIVGDAPVVGYFGACAVTEASVTVDDPQRTEFLKKEADR